MVSVSVDGGARFVAQPALDRLPNRGGGRLVALGGRLLALYDAHAATGAARFRVRDDDAPLSSWSPLASAFPEGIYHGAALSAVTDGAGGADVAYKDKAERLWLRHFDGVAFGSGTLLVGERGLGAPAGGDPRRRRHRDLLQPARGPRDRATSSPRACSRAARSARRRWWTGSSTFKCYPAAPEALGSASGIPVLYASQPADGQWGQLLASVLAWSGDARAAPATATRPPPPPSSPPPPPPPPPPTSGAVLFLDAFDRTGSSLGPDWAVRGGYRADGNAVSTGAVHAGPRHRRAAAPCADCTVEALVRAGPGPRGGRLPARRRRRPAIATTSSSGTTDSSCCGASTPGVPPSSPRRRRASIAGRRPAHAGPPAVGRSRSSRWWTASRASPPPTRARARTAAPGSPGSGPTPPTCASTASCPNPRARRTRLTQERREPRPLEHRRRARHAREIEPGHERARPEVGAGRGEAGERGEEPHHRRRVRPAGPQVGHREGPVALREPRPVLADHERHVREPRRRQRERPVEQELPGGRREQVVAAHHVGDPHGGVVHHHRELIGRDAVGPGDHEVAGLRRDVVRALSVNLVLERDPALRHPQPPGRRAGHRAGAPPPSGRGRGRSRVAGPLVGRAVRGAGGRRDLGARAEAGVDQPGRAQARERVVVPRRSAPTGGKARPDRPASGPSSQSSPSQRSSSRMSRLEPRAGRGADRGPRPA